MIELGEVTIAPGGRHPRKLVRVERVVTTAGLQGRVHVSQDHVALARGIERGDEQAVVAARVQLRDRRARVRPGAVGVEPLGLARARSPATCTVGQTACSRVIG